MSPRFANMAHWEVLEESCGSDHTIVSMEFQCHVKYEDLCNPRWLFQWADWDKFVFCVKKNCRWWILIIVWSELMRSLQMH